MKFIGTRIDPDCVEAENVLRQACIPFDYVDISGRVENLVGFINLRDKSPEFDPIKLGGFVGLPCFIMEDGEILFDENKVIEKFALLEEEKKAEELQLA